ncbi:uncharacterized protein JCM10292_005344 [Rhodotorula paludigena]|uniref:uncharacterized protein n=1 Tax=Rhodotorula paludigena TaxID=86838 RepID=UPI003179145B
MERRLDEEKKAVVLSDDEVDAAVDKPKRRRRKATPAVLVSAPTSDVEWDNEGRRSVLSSMASAGSPPPLVDKHNRRPDERGQFESAHHRARRDPSRRRSIRSVPSEDTRGSATGACQSPLQAAVNELIRGPFADRRSSRKERRPLSPSLEPSDHRPPRSRSARASSLPAQAHINNYERATHSRSREEDVSDTPAFPTRSSRRRPSRSRRSTASPTPIETPRSPGKAASPASSVEEDHKGSGAGDFLDAAAGAVEQVSEAVSSALSRMLPGLFSISSNSSMG